MKRITSWFWPRLDQRPSSKTNARVARGNAKTTRRISGAIALVFMIALCPRLLASDDHNPIGVTGTFEGVITTGCAYNVLSHNATRQIDDIVVPGAIGKYGLKMTRYYNSRQGFGDGWRHGYF